jgi:hypothetical protein
MKRLQYMPIGRTSATRHAHSTRAYRCLIGTVFFAVLLGTGAALVSCSSDEDGADLAIIQAPRLNPVVPAINQSILVSATVTNRSDTTSGSTTVALILDGAELVRVPFDSLPPQSSGPVSTSFSIPTDGAHAVSLLVDPDQGTDDPHRSNNLFTFSVTVTSSTVAPISN